MSLSKAFADVWRGVLHEHPLLRRRGGMWFCSTSEEVFGFGATPQLAYSSWQLARDEWRRRVSGAPAADQDTRVVMGMRFESSRLFEEARKWLKNTGKEG